VLFRGDYNGVFSKPIKAELSDMEIPVDDPAWINEVLAAAQNRAVLLMLRLLTNRHDSLAWAGLIYLEPYAEDFPGSPSASATRAKALVARVIGWLERRDVPDQLNDSRWGALIVEALSQDPGAPLSDELADLLLGVDEVIEPAASLGRYLSQIQPLARDRAQAQAGGVRFMSMASSKGLTVEAAIMVAAEEGVIPRPDADIAEERRLLYVAMTRARRFQYVTWARRRTGPTARAGTPRVQARRTESRFLRNGPVQTQDGATYIRERWDSAAVA
jgi:superfamily I DNA/RNA helicase